MICLPVTFPKKSVFHRILLLKAQRFWITHWQNFIRPFHISYPEFLAGCTSPSAIWRSSDAITCSEDTFSCASLSQLQWHIYIISQNNEEAQKAQVSLLWFILACSKSSLQWSISNWYLSFTLCDDKHVVHSFLTWHVRQQFAYLLMTLVFTHTALQMNDDP